MVGAIPGMDVSMEETSYVGLQRFCKISKHILPSAYTEGRSGSELLVSVLSFQTNHLGENIFDTNRTTGGLFGYSSEN